MAAAVGKYAARKMMAGELKKYQKKSSIGQYDPYYEIRADPRSGKEKKYKKQIPDYIPEHDAKILASVRRRAYRLDCALCTIFGIRFGWESVIGLIPFIGDAIGVMMALALFKKANKVSGGLPQSVRSTMVMWIALDFFVGLVPFVGDLLDATIKCNTYNCRTLEQYLDKKYKPKAVQERDDAEDRANRQRFGTSYPSHAPATEYEDLSDSELPQYSTHPPSRQNTVQRPEAAAAAEERRGGERVDRSGSRRSWLGGLTGSKKSKARPAGRRADVVDVEAARQAPPPAPPSAAVAAAEGDRKGRTAA